MNSETLFYQRVSERRVSLQEYGRPGYHLRAVSYVNSACVWAEQLEIEGLPVHKLTPADAPDRIDQALFLLEDFMEGVRAKNIFVLEPHLEVGSVRLDIDWKTKATDLVNRVREIVKRAEVPQNLREAISVIVE